ncbi:hypothetical protein A2U01_0086390, partial [Trifolium medium]|nr:hypothetical protein [Trifolium medium]
EKKATLCHDACIFAASDVRLEKRVTEVTSQTLHVVERYEDNEGGRRQAVVG